MARVQGLKPKPNHLRPNFKVWFSILAELNSEFSLGLTKNALNQTKLNFGSTNTDEEKLCFQLIKDLDHAGGHVKGSLTSKKYMHNCQGTSDSLPLASSI